MLILWLIIVEAGLYTIGPLWRYRRFISLVLGFGFLSYTFLAWLHEPSWWLGVFSIIIAFKLINFARIIKNRLQADYLKTATRRSGLMLSGTIGIWYATANFTSLESDQWLAAITILQAAAALGLVAVTARNLFKITRRQLNTQYFSDKELPTVSVAIPARNETADLTSCLVSVLASDYPKLEVLVLDDCSQDRTSEIIKSFAHDGVRFIKGRQPDSDQVAKNFAYDQLVQAANGDYLLFIGVDVRLGPNAIKTLVSQAMIKKRAMMSVLPFRLSSDARTALVQPLRYWWELALPRRLVNRPPVLSTCWLIHRQALKDLGGFGAVMRNIIPERYFARELIKKDLYSFVRSDDELDVRTVKLLEQQVMTAVRVKYPQLRRRPENVLLLGALEAIVLLGPFVLLPLTIFGELGSYFWLTVISCLALIINHVVIMSATNPGNILVGFINFPFAVLMEIGITVISLFLYEFGTISWRGRNVCIPVMQTLPSSVLKSAH